MMNYQKPKDGVDMLIKGELKRRETHDRALQEFKQAQTNPQQGVQTMKIG